MYKIKMIFVNILLIIVLQTTPANLTLSNHNTLLK